MFIGSTHIECEGLYGVTECPILEAFLVKYARLRGMTVPLHNNLSGMLWETQFPFENVIILYGGDLDVNDDPKNINDNSNDNNDGETIVGIKEGDVR